MRTMTLLLVALALTILVTGPAVAQFDLSWTGPVTEGTRITVHDLYGDRPGVPGPVVFDGQTPSTRPTAVDTIRVVFGDAPHLQRCRRTVLQDPLEHVGADAVFTARLGPFASTDTISVFFVWSRSLLDEAYDPIVGVYLGASRPRSEPDPGPPSQPGKPTFTSG